MALILSLICAMLAAADYSPFPGITISLLKLVAVAAIAAFVVINSANRHHVLLLIALLALAFTPADGIDIQKEVGLHYYSSRALFFLFLIILFLMNKTPVHSLNVRRLNLAACIGAAMILFGYWIFPRLGDHWIEYTLYSIVLLLFGLSAALSRFSLHLIGFGAIMFIIGDLSQYSLPFINIASDTVNLIWAINYLGILFITVSIMLAEDFQSGKHSYYHH